MAAPLAVLAFLAASALATGTDPLATLAALEAAPNGSARFKLLKDSDWTFDYERFPGTITTGKGGVAVAASRANFPALFSQGMAGTVGFLGPCGLNTPHVHPRSPELQFVTAGGPLLTAFAAENGVGVVSNTLIRGQATIFPQGSIHFQQNLGCEPAVFFAAFRDEDPATLQVAQAFESLDIDVQNAVLGYPGTSELMDLHNKTQANIAYGTEACLKRCGIDVKSLPQTSTDRVALTDWAASSGSSSGGSGYASSLKAGLGVSDIAADNVAVTAGSSSSAAPASFWDDASKLRPAFAATLATLVLTLGALAGLGFAFRRRNARQASRSVLFNDVTTGSDGKYERLPDPASEKASAPYSTPYDPAPETRTAA